MFKGLRTKIESEQTGDGASKQPQVASTSRSTFQNQQKQITDESTPIIISKSPPSSIISNLDSQPGVSTNKTSNAKQPQITSNTLFSNPNSTLVNAPGLQHDEHKELSLKDGDGLLGTIADLKNEISRLHEKLRTVIKERDDSNEQNTQLYQLIEKLRKNLDTEKESNVQLQSKLTESQTALRENNDIGRYNKATNSISIRSFDLVSDDAMHEESSEDVASLRKKLAEFKAQLTDKNRQFKIKQQNLNDIKRALQKEMSEHAKTQEDLHRIQNQLKQLEFDRNHASLQNGSDSTNTKFPNPSDKQQTEDLTGQSVVEGNQNPNNDALDNYTNTTPDVNPNQFDTMSHISRSSASVDEYDSNDFHQSSCNIGVNHEYLKNVLFRYMTSTDTETARHLVKALSVLMNFSPEQSAAVKSAMNSKSSWVRFR